MDFSEWNKLIAQYFFNEEMSGREVLLYVNEKLINRLGEPFNADVNDFINAVKAGRPDVTRSGFCQKAFQTYKDWRSWKLFEYPPYIAYLAFFVLAGGTQGDFAAQAYYPRLRKLLGEPEDAGQPPSFDRMIDLWDDLEKWSREDKHEELGRFVARIRGGWWKVGLPLSQTILSEDERKLLPNLFSEANLDPTNSPSPEIMPRILLTYGQDIFEKRTLRLLDNSRKEDSELKDALIALILDELEEWDGTVIAQETEEQGASRSRVQAGLRICLHLDSVAQSVNCYLRFKTGKVFPEDGLNFEQSGNSHIWSCTESHQGWSKPLRDHQVNPVVTLDAASIAWEEGMQLVDNENHWRARLRESTVRLFLLGQLEGLPDWIESQRLEKGIEFLVTCKSTEAEKLRKWGSEYCEKFQQKSASGLPAGWLLFLGNNANQSCPGVDVLFVSSSLRLLLKRGIKISGNTYLRFPLPEVVLENSSGNETITLNGTALKRPDHNIPVWQLPQDTPVNETLKIEVKVGEQELRRVLRLEEPSLPLSFNQTFFRDPAGKIHTDGSSSTKDFGVIVDSGQSGNQTPSYPEILPTHLSKRIVFTGEKPGQIADWPREPLPFEWHPVWAIAKHGNRDWEAHFCGKPEQAKIGHCKNEPFGNTVERRKWREALWINRKITKQPQLGQLCAVWVEYMKVAQNV